MKILSLLTLLPFLATSQETVFKDYNWDEKPVYMITPESQNSEDVLELKDKRFFELLSDKDGAYEYVLTHEIKKVNTDIGIEKNNKVYIYESLNRKIIKNLLRVINPDGKIIEFDKSDLQEAEDQATKAKYKYYAVKGLEKGSIIEQVLVTKNTSSFDGKILRIQSDNPSKNIEIQVIHPSHLIYDVKSYNGAPKAQFNDSIYLGKIAHILTIDSCPGLDEEKYSNYSANTMAFAYKLTGNKNSNNLNLNSFKTVAEDIHKNIYRELENKDQSSIEKYISSIQFPENATQEDSIKAIEHHLKLDIIYIETYRSEKPSLTATIQAKKANASGLMLLVCNIFKAYNIQHEIVITNNRFDFPFDPKFEIMSQLDEFLIYFPKSKRFLSPTSQGNRYPHFSYRLGENYGLFIKTINLGGSEVVMSQAKKINIESDYDGDSTDIQIDFTKNINLPSYIISNTLTGYEAENNQYVFDFLDDKQKKEFANEYMKNYSGEAESENQTLNYGKENIGLKPFIVSASFASNKLIEKNAENILFKIGESIGKQDELYQEKPRQTPVESTYPRTYKRRIRVSIPPNYQFNNLEGLKLNFDLRENGKSQAGFHSDFKVTDTELDIYIYEYYYKINFPVSAYNDYKNVINAAADFNKAKIILSKKE
jgi:hypothetical protein